MDIRTALRSSFNYPYSCFWILIIYSLGLWSYCVPFTGDEKVYISTAMEMREKGSWLFPYLFGEHSYFKPPFQYWTVLLSWKIFGFNSFSTYFPSVLALTGTAWLIGRIHQLIRPISNRSEVPARAIDLGIAPIWFAGCFGTMTYGTTVQMEIWIVFFSTAVWWASLRFLDSNQWRWLYLGVGLAGLFALVKSPLYSVFSIFGLWIYLALVGRLDLFKKFHFYGAHALGVILGLVWYILVLSTDRERFWNHYFSTETFSKVGGNGSTPLKMWLDFSTFSQPFSLLFLPLILITARAVAKNLGSGNWIAHLKTSRTAFILASTVFPSIFFSIFPYRTETYLYILLPTFVLWLEWELVKQLEVGSRLVVWGIRLNGILVFTLSIAASLILIAGRITAFHWSLLLPLICGLFCYQSWQLRWKSMAFSCLILVTLIRFASISLGEEDISILRDVAHKNPEREFAIYDENKNIWNEIGLLSVALGKISQRTYSPDEAVNALNSGKILVVSDLFQSQLTPIIERSFAGDRSLEIIEWKRWKRTFHAPSLNDFKSLGDRNRPDWENKNRREYKILLLKK